MKYEKIVEMLHYWEDMLKDLDKSCLTTHSWKKIEERL